MSLRRVGLAAIVSVAMQSALAQPNPWPVKESASTTLPPESPGLTPQAVVDIFRQACIATEGESAAALDWALAQGFEPLDPTKGSADEVMAGLPSTVLTAPGSGGRVLLAVSTGGPCTVWALRMPGPPVRLALTALIGELVPRGVRAQLQVDRTVERAGTWRQQMQWRYRRAGGSQDLGIGAVTTVQDDAPGTQLLHLAVLPARSNFEPDGQAAGR